MSGTILLSSTLVIGGECLLFGALLPLLSIVRTSNRSRGWLALVSLVVFFILGYAAHLAVLFTAQPTVMDVIISGILFGGGLFVFLVSRLARDSIVAQADQALAADYRANHDELTGLPSRRLLLKSAEELCRAAHLKPSLFSYLLIDVNRFKDVNDALGYTNGDAVLKELGGRLRAAYSDGSLTARLSGDAFLMLLPNSDAQDAQRVAQTVHQNILEPIRVDGHNITVDASVGIATYPKDAADPVSLLRCADAAMFVAKRRHNPIVIYEDGMNESAGRRLWGGTAIRRAIENHEFSIVYQPKYGLESMKAEGLEALVRWESQELGNIGPDNFIDLAERVGLIRELSDEVVRLVLQDRNTWLPLGIPIWINLSAHDMVDETLPDRLLGALKEAEVPTSMLGIEITETAMLVDQRQASINARALSTAGIRLSVDDFGTGYSTLSHLVQFPVSEIKIDKVFVSNLSEDQTSESIIKACIEMAHNLSMTVTAEGIEDAHTLAMLRHLGCDAAQGYLMARPMKLDQLFQQGNFPDSAAAAVS